MKRLQFRLAHLLAMVFFFGLALGNWQLQYHLFIVNARPGQGLVHVGIVVISTGIGAVVGRYAFSQHGVLVGSLLGFAAALMPCCYTSLLIIEGVLLWPSHEMRA